MPRQRCGSWRDSANPPPQYRPSLLPRHRRPHQRRPAHEKAQPAGRRRPGHGHRPGQAEGIERPREQHDTAGERPPGDAHRRRPGRVGARRQPRHGEQGQRVPHVVLHRRHEDVAVGRLRDHRRMRGVGPRRRRQQPVQGREEKPQPHDGPSNRVACDTQSMKIRAIIEPSCIAPWGHREHGARKEIKSGATRRLIPAIGHRGLREDTEITESADGARESRAPACHPDAGAGNGLEHARHRRPDYGSHGGDHARQWSVTRRPPAFQGKRAKRNKHFSVTSVSPLRSLCRSPPMRCAVSEQ